MTPITRLLVILIALATCPVQARDRPFVDEPSQERDDIEEGTPWQERDFTLPPYPDDADLLEFPVDDGDSRLRYFVDARHLKVGTDGVVHYTLVVKSASGAPNVSVEGIRCDQNQFKTYAFGTGRGTLKPVKAPRWERIGGPGQSPHYRDLREFFFCRQDRYAPQEKEDIVRLLGSTPRRGDDQGFLP